MFPQRLERAGHVLYILPSLPRIRDEGVREFCRAFQPRPGSLCQSAPVCEDPIANFSALEVLPKDRSEADFRYALFTSKTHGVAISNSRDFVIAIEMVEEKAVVVGPLVDEDAAEYLRLIRELEEQPIQIVASVRIRPRVFGELLLSPF